MSPALSRERRAPGSGDGKSILGEFFLRLQVRRDFARISEVMEPGGRIVEAAASSALQSTPPTISARLAPLQSLGVMKPSKKAPSSA